MFPFLIIIVATIFSCIQYSDASDKISESDSEDIFDTSKTETEIQESLKSLKTSTNVNTEINEPAAPNTSEDTSNIMSNITSGESITMTISDLSPGNQFSNLTEVEPKARLTIQEKLSKGIIPNVEIITPPPAYKVTVVFDSITVHNNHEGLFSGDGEFDMAAFVQGINVDLTGTSYPGGAPYAYTSALPPVGLGDVSEGQTIKFTPVARVTVDLPSTAQLSIFTVGRELDSCDQSDYPLPKGLVEVFKNPPLDWYTPITQYLSNKNFLDCGYDDSEFLGNIIKFYNPPGSSYEPIGYGAGAHTNVVSDKGDYTLRYTINVAPLPTPVEKHIDSNKFSNKFESNNTFAFNKLD